LTKLETTEITYHRLLKRQIRKSLPPELAESPALQDFLATVNQAYVEFQDDITRVEHILEQSSAELFKANLELTTIADQKTEEAASVYRRLEEVASSITEVLIQLDQEGNIIYLNNAWETVTTFPVKDSLNKNWTEFQINADAKIRLLSLFSGETRSIQETFALTTIDGSKRWLEISMSSQLSDSHQVTGFIGTLSDITARMEADTKLKSYMRDLERINAELDQFAYVVSHDLKAPLRAINNLSEWIEEDIGDLLEGDTKDQFRLLRGRVHRMESLINGILSYSRAGRIKTTKERFLVKSLVDDLCDTFSSKKPVEFILEGDQKLELVTEKITLGQILQNLISNGIKYNDKPEIKITIGWKELDEGHEFFVKDNGPGISPEFHDKIFVIFQTLQARDEVESTGVGLAIVKKIMDEKGAKIRIESTMSSGTTFYFTWPGNEV
jgi:PAS domain S-box-containing protein